MLRLQTIVSRELASEAAVVTVGAHGVTWTTTRHFARLHARSPGA